MWTLKIEIDCSKGILGSRTKKYNLRALTYPTFFQHMKNKVYVYGIFHMFGSEENKKRFIEDFKTDPRCINFEQKGDAFIAQIIEDPKYAPSYGPGVFVIEPVYIDQKGTEVWTFGAWKKQDLIKILKLVEKYNRGVLLTLKKSEVKYMSLINMLPNLSKKQKQAMDLAIKAGYYNFPKKIKLVNLAKQISVSYSTFQAHLKKAEKKLIPHIFKKVNYQLKENKNTEEKK